MLDFHGGWVPFELIPHSALSTEYGVGLFRGCPFRCGTSDRWRAAERREQIEREPYEE